MVKVEQAYAFQIVRTARLMRLHFTRFAQREGFDISQEQWLILNKLAQNPGLSQLELGDSLIHDKPNITRILAGLEKKKLIQRRVDSEDRRIMRVQLTAAGKKIHAELSSRVAAERNVVQAGLTEADFAALMRVCRQLETNITQSFAGD